MNNHFRYYEISVSGEPHNRCFEYLCSIGNDHKCYGTSTTIKKAKDIAAKNMLTYLDANMPLRPADSTNFDNSLNSSTNSSNSGDASFNSISSNGGGTNDDTRDINELLEICIKYSLTSTFDMVQTGAPHFPSFTCICTVNDQTCEATASTKKRAKVQAARAMVDIVNNVIIPNIINSISYIAVRPLEEVLADYRKIKENDKNFVKKKANGARTYRHPFGKIGAVLRERAIQLLKSDDLVECSSEAIIKTICKTMELEYEIKALPGHPNNQKLLKIKHGDSDSVFVQEENALGTRFFEFCCNMLSVNKFN